MMFSEVYSAYYNALARILAQAVEGRLDKAGLEETVRQYGFEESILTIPGALKDESWPLLKPDLTTPLQHTPTMPLTTLQKRWLKTLLQDPRVRLFDPPTAGLEAVQPLYPRDAIVYFDQYLDGDPFEDEGYIRRFRTILTAIREKRWVRVGFIGHNGIHHQWRCVPYRLEYSAKDDKFRLLSANNRESLSINLGRVCSCRLEEPCREAEYRPLPMKKRKLVLELTDERNALERAMLHFSHLEKETERLENDRYRITLHYEHGDETELLIRVLSFGPMLKVVFPDDFRRQLLERLQRQKDRAAE